MPHIRDDGELNRWIQNREKDEAGCMTFWLVIAALIGIFVFAIPIGMALLSD